MCASLFPHLLYYYWYEVGLLKLSEAVQGHKYGVQERRAFRKTEKHRRMGYFFTPQIFGETCKAYTMASIVP